MGSRRIATALLVSVAFACLAACLAAAQCVGDCDGDGEVRIDELVRGTLIAHGGALSLCPSFETDGNGVVTVDEILVGVAAALDGCSVGAAAPALRGSDPAQGAEEVLRTAWVRLDFSGMVDPSTARGFRLTCGGRPRALAVHAITATSLVINPAGALPPESACTLSWLGPDGPQSLDFSTARAGPLATVLYDRTAAAKLVPYPDDIWTKPDASAPSQVRISLPNALTGVFRVFLREMNRLDGFSPVGHFVIETSDAPDPSSLPHTAAESLDPLATIGLFDIDEGSAEYGHRVPFHLEDRTDSNTTGVVSHSLLIYPAIPLTPGGRYGLVITRRARVDATRPLDPSAFFSAALGEATQSEAVEVTQVRRLAGDVLDVVARRATPPIPPDDVALALRISVRTTDDIPADLLAIKDQVLSADPPAFSVDSVEESTGDVAAIVHGTWQAPDWRDGLFFKRAADGRPVSAKTNAVPFVLALPRAALSAPAPMVMYQHGNPGSAEREVPNEARNYLGGAGFAVVGFTDNLNREVSRGMGTVDEQTAAQVSTVFFALIDNRRVPDFWAETNAEQIAFIRMIQGLGTLDVLPIGAPDGVPDLDVEAPLSYVGISEGANHAPALLPYAPEIHAAAVIVGGGRLAETLLHQQAQEFIDTLGPVFPDLTAADIWVGLALFQALYDRQESHNHAPFIYRMPLAVAGTTRKASILLVEGLQDSMVPNNATDSLAWSLGPLPHLEPVQRPVPYLEAVAGPLMANIDAETSAAFFQYVPVGVSGIDPTPGCVTLAQHEGHFCAQVAPESRHQRLVFLRSGLEGVPRIVDPFSE